MDLGITDKVRPLIAAVRDIVRNDVIPIEDEYEAEIGRNGNRFEHTPRQIEIFEGLKQKARAKGLWNFWLTGSERGYGLKTVEYAYLAEEMGWSMLGPEVFNCSAPDTGNMEVIERYGSAEQKARWLPDLLEGKTRSAYLMTEPGVASSDATNISMDAKEDGDHWVLNGEKWWSSGAGDPRCTLYITMTKTDPDGPKHARHSMFFVPARHAGHHETARDEGLWQRRRAARPPAHSLRERARAEIGAGARPWPRFRDRARASGAGPHPPLHARHRPGRARAGGNVQALRFARGVRSETRPTRRQSRHHRRGAHEHRDGAACFA